jgi:hypothetical protein
LTAVRTLFLAVVLVACLAAAPARAQSVAAQVLARRCAASGGRPVAQTGLTRAIAIGGQAASALDPQRLTCAGAAPVDCGAFGCKLSIYFDATTPVFETYVKAWRARGGKLEILRVGAYCAGAGESCSETYRREGEGLTLTGKGEAIFARDAAPPPRAKAVRAAKAPPKAAQAARAARGKPDRRGARSTRGRFDAAPAATAPSQATQTAAPVAPAVSAARRRRLDAAPYVP